MHARMTVRHRLYLLVALTLAAGGPATAQEFAKPSVRLPQVPDTFKAFWTPPIPEPADPIELARKGEGGLPGARWSPVGSASDQEAVHAPGAGLAQHLWKRVHYDRPAGGALWARAKTYKARFDEGGATYIPFLGADAPRNYPLRLRLESITVGGTELPFEGRPDVRQEGDRVLLDRGAVVELYELGLESMEQLFFFDLPPAGGDVVIRIAVESELTPGEDAAGLAFAGAWGGVHYGRAVALTAGGSSSLATSVSSGAIEIRVPAAIAAEAGPFVIDPVISTFSLGDGNWEHLPESNPDVAYEDVLDLGVYVWEVKFSAADSDVISVAVDRDGNFTLGSTGWVDTTDENWVHPRIAANRLAESFLIVAERDPGAGGEIWGRMRDRFNLQGNPFVIASSASYGLRNPDVGGDPTGVGPTYFLVAFEHVWNENVDHDVHAQLVSGGGALVGNRIIVDGSTALDREVQVSNSNGIRPFPTQRWTLAWRRVVNGQGDIYGAQLDWQGFTVHPTFAIESSNLSSSRPSISTVLDGASGERAYMVTFDHRRANNAVDVGAVVMRGNQKIAPTSGSIVYLSDAGDWAGKSSVDSDGSSFLVSYCKRDGLGTLDPIRAFAQTFQIEDASIVNVDALVELDSTLLQVFPEPRVAADRSGGGDPQGFWVAWQRWAGSPDAGNMDVQGATWRSPGIGTRYGAALVNSSGLAAKIFVTGSRSLSEGAWTLEVRDAPAGKSGLFFFGTAQIDTAFGEGRRLVGGSVARMNHVVTANGAGSISYPPDPIAPYYSQLHSGPQNMNYQFWFRDPGHDGNGNGVAQGFNLTDAISVEHTP